VEAADADDEDESDSEMTDADIDIDIDPIESDRIDFETFQDLDVRVGEILEAEGIEGADKLARLVVDIGVEERQIVAGIKQLHDLDTLPGTRVIVLANLEQAELFGVESNGMVLAAGEEADLLTTVGDAVPGERVR
jgi:methionyl-tRNA synthetase